ncbi:uncharacterized protein METZ01_LOCUS185588 [marine metagenome]|uniref:Uncharacterized protein n=1 Tax=marine metagenome TaxID=408172 RepID=A0A382D3X3_9ZZZZ
MMASQSGGPTKYSVPYYRLQKQAFISKLSKSVVFIVLVT